MSVIHAEQPESGCNVPPEKKPNALYAQNYNDIRAAASGDSHAKEELVKRNMGLVRSIAGRFRDRIGGNGDTHGCDFEDLLQIGTIGLMKAINSFDLSYGTAFSTYAVPLIIGEIRRFLRDDGIIKISRTTKKQNAVILREREAYLKKNGVEPTLDELAVICGISREELVFALGSGTPCNSLNAEIGEDGNELGDILPDSENSIEILTDRIALRDAIMNLPPEQRKIIQLRYFHDLSQQQTADLLGLTQVKISREEKKIFEKLRSVL